MGLTWALSVILVYVFSFREDFKPEDVGVLSIFGVFLVAFSVLGLIL